MNKEKELAVRLAKTIWTRAYTFWFNRSTAANIGAPMMLMDDNGVALYGLIEVLNYEEQTITLRLTPDFSGGGLSGTSDLFKHTGK